MSRKITALLILATLALSQWSITAHAAEHGMLDHEHTYGHEHEDEHGQSECFMCHMAHQQIADTSENNGWTYRSAHYQEHITLPHKQSSNTYRDNSPPSRAPPFYS